MPEYIKKIDAVADVDDEEIWRVARIEHFEIVVSTNASVYSLAFFDNDIS